MLSIIIDILFKLCHMKNLACNVQIICDVKQRNMSVAQVLENY